MSVQYTPKWKDDKGNVVIFPARNTLFDSENDAREWQIGQFLFMIPFGLCPAGILEFEAQDGKTQILHRAAKYGMLGECGIIVGPMFEEAEA